MALKDWLIANGWADIFIDIDPERGLKAGQRWQEELKRAAERCNSVICLVSPDWCASKWCLLEFMLASALSKRIFGVIIAPTRPSDIPPDLRSEWQLVDLTLNGPTDNAHNTRIGSGTPRHAWFSSSGLEHLRLGLNAAGLEANFFKWPPENEPDRSPYRGLRPLEPEDAGIFFGRDAPVLKMMDLIRQHREATNSRLFAILGASGAGKSSFLRAGLYPRLLREDFSFMPLPVVRPERSVLYGETGLLASLEQVSVTFGLPRSRAEIRKAIAGGPKSIKELLLALVEKRASRFLAPGNRPLTVVFLVDQTEELFAAETKTESSLFMSILSDTIFDQTIDTMAIFAIRSDSYEKLQTSNELAGITHETLSLLPMAKGSYAEVIKAPLRRLRGTGRPASIEDTLVDRLLADIENNGGGDCCHYCRSRWKGFLKNIAQKEY